MHLLIVEVIVIEVHAVMLVVVNLLSPLIAVGLSLLGSSLIVISGRTIFLSPFICWFLSGPAVFFALLDLSQLCLSMCISALCSFGACSLLKTETDLCLVKSANEFSQFRLAMRVGASFASLTVAFLELRTIPCLVKSIMRSIIDRNINIRNGRFRHFLVVLKKSRKSLFDLKIVLTRILVVWTLQSRRSRFILIIRNNWVNNIHLVSNISQIDYRRWLNIYFFVVNFTSIIEWKLLLRVNKISPLSASPIPGSAAIRALFAGR